MPSFREDLMVMGSGCCALQGSRVLRGRDMAGWVEEVAGVKKWVTLNK